MSNKKAFKMPYIGIDTFTGYDILYGQNGGGSIIIKMDNPVCQYSGAASSYDEFHSLLLNIIKILGEGYYLQKQDVFARVNYPLKKAPQYLRQKYHMHFAGRQALELNTYLTITFQVKRGTFYVHDHRKLGEFAQKITKVFDLLAAAGCMPMVLKNWQLQRYIKQVLAMDFSKPEVVLDNLSAEETGLGLGRRKVRSISLIDTDATELPTEISTHTELNDKDSLRGFPVDLLSFLWRVPNFELLIYNQVIEIPAQNITINKLNIKKKRHSGIPDPANLICVEDIDLLLKDVAKENQLLVNAHFNILICAENEPLQQACNFVESELFKLGIIPCRNSYNQLELFRSALPGNCTELRDYDLFLTTCEAAACFLFKESLMKDDPSDFLVYFTDRRGIPLGIDLSDLPWRTGRITARNRFCLGPSGSGKSYVLNAILEQYLLYNMDVVVIDTGHSYSGLCSYYKGKYITWSDDKPITMNPFMISEQEYNIEKKDFLCTLICLLWKGADGFISPVERDLISGLISAYYQRFFQSSYPGLSKKELLEIRKELMELLRSNRYFNQLPSADQKIIETELLKEALSDIDEPLHKASAITEAFRKAYRQHYQSLKQDKEYSSKALFENQRIKELNFNTFYEFAMERIPEVKIEDQIPFDLQEFRFVLKKFYKGGEFQAILNEAADKSLFTAPFIVFEIDNVKNNKVLFPIVTLVIMDVFIQKMRFREHRRKALIVEEAWKAIASPLMADYLVFLYKTVRKFWGEVIVVTQELSDIIGNSIVKDSIISNSDTTILLDQTKFKDNYKDIAALLSISDTEQRKIFTINQLENKSDRRRFSEVYIRRGSTGEVYGNEVSLEQHLVYTTEKPEKTAVSIYTDEHKGDFTAGLDAFVTDLKASKLSESAFIAKINELGHPLYKS